MAEKAEIDDSYFSVNTAGIKDASFDLIVLNAEHLISSIYANRMHPPYNRREIRVGLVIKILLRSTRNYSGELLQPVIDDLENMLSDENYIKKNGGQMKRSAISKELSLLRRFVECDDAISLNTLQNRAADHALGV